jgi:small redox-active disulfide protein 2
VKVEVLGPGCPKCAKLAQMVEKAIGELGMNIQVVKVTDIQKIVESGIMSTPGLKINGELKSTGRLPGREEIKKWLAEAQLKGGA